LKLRFDPQTIDDQDKGDSVFCYPEHIEAEMRRLFRMLRHNHYLHGLSADAFSPKAAHFIAELNPTSPIRPIVTI